MIITNVLWFTQVGATRTLGLVFGVDEHDGTPKAYIGSGAGISEEADTATIAKTGAKLTTAHATAIAKHFATPLPKVTG